MVGKKDIAAAEEQLRETLKNMAEHRDRTAEEINGMAIAAIHGAGQYLMELAWRDAELVAKTVSAMQSMSLVVGLFAFAAFDMLGDLVRDDHELERIRKAASTYIVLAHGMPGEGSQEKIAQLTATSFQCQLALQLYPRFLKRVEKFTEIGIEGMAAIMEERGGDVDN